MLKKITTTLFYIRNYRTSENIFLEKVIVWLTILFHIAISDFPPVNLEWAFSDAALFFTGKDHRYIEQYFTYQANTLAFPFLTAVFSKIIPFLSVMSMTRILSAIGFYFLGIALLKINRLIKTDIPGYFLLLIVFLNPLLWTFGGRGTADFLPAALGIYGLSLFWEKQIQGWKNYCSIFILGFAIVLKYHSVLLLVPIVLEIFLQKKQNWKTSFRKAVSTVISVMIFPVLYILLVKHELGFWLTPPTYMERHKLSSSNFFTNFIIYFGYLALLLLPFSIFSIWHFFRRIPPKNRLYSTIMLIIIGTILLTFGFFWLRPQGEMNFGPLDGVITVAISGGSFMMLALIMGIVIYQGFEQTYLCKNRLTQSKRYILSLLAGVVIFLFILSFTRPTQRYLMFILPFSYFFMISDIFKSKKNNFIAIGMYIIINLLLLYNQYISGTASQIMVNEIRKRGIVEKTDGGAINPHAGNVFFRYRKNKKEYMIVEGSSAGSLFTSEAGFTPLAKKSYSLVVIH